MYVRGMTGQKMFVFLLMSNICVMGTTWLRANALRRNFCLHKNLLSKPIHLWQP